MRFSCVLHEITACYKRVTRKFLQNRQATGTDRPQQTTGRKKRHFGQNVSILHIITLLIFLFFSHLFDCSYY